MGMITDGEDYSDEDLVHMKKYAQAFLEAYTGVIGIKTAESWIDWFIDNESFWEKYYQENTHVIWERVSQIMSDHHRDRVAEP